MYFQKTPPGETLRYAAIRGRHTLVARILACDPPLHIVHSVDSTGKSLATDVLEHLFHVCGIYPNEVDDVLRAQRSIYDSSSNTELLLDFVKTALLLLSFNSTISQDRHVQSTLNKLPQSLQTALANPQATLARLKEEEFIVCAARIHCAEALTSMSLT